MYFPSEGDRIAVTIGHHTWVGTATDIMPFHQDDLGVWIGGWHFSGIDPAGNHVETAMACPRSMALHDKVTMIVRPATGND